jgi:hypothetical protein
MISPEFCGSDATGWVETKRFQKTEARRLTLATAMATSAAALNPNAGVSGEGYTRNKMVSILLSMLNLRLGYWTENPRCDKDVRPPNFISPGISSEILRNGFKETDSRILLSDGGHFENLGLYELIRRKLDLIIISDGGADGIFNFDDLANAVEKVRVDFGALVEFIQPDTGTNSPGCGLDGILFDVKTNDIFRKKYEIAQRGYAIADITYLGGKTGKLIYLKLAMVHNLPTDVYSYKGLNPDFPHQSTADQFFDEKQFEAYRELGYRTTKDMIGSPLGSAVLAMI